MTSRQVRAKGEISTRISVQSQKIVNLSDWNRIREPVVSVLIGRSACDFKYNLKFETGARLSGHAQ